MGMQCCRAHFNSPTTTSSRIQNAKPQQLLQGNISQIFIDAFTLPPDNLISDINNRISEHTAILNLSNIYGSTDSVAFVPRVGFIKQTPNYQHNEYSIVFQLNKQQQNTTSLQIKLGSALKLWKKIANEGINIKQNSQLCIGSNQFLLKYLITRQKINYNKQHRAQNIKKCQQNKKQQCRICLLDNQSQENKLVMACQCIGSLSTIHQLCLRDWIFGGKNKLIEFQQNMQYINLQIKHGCCQICKYSFQQYIYNQIIKILDRYENILYAVFEIKNIMDIEQKIQEYKNYLVFKFYDINQLIRIGSSKQCQYVIRNQHLLSPVNTCMMYNQGKIKIIDNLSKFGTFIFTKKKYLSVNTNYRILNLFFNIQKMH